MPKGNKIKLNRINKATFLTKSKMKKKLEPGGILEQYGQPIQQGLGLAGGISDSLLPEDSLGGGALSGGLRGASAGMAFGPIGAGVGAVAGAGLGALQANKVKKANEVAKMNRKVAIDQSLMQNAGNSFKDGGRLLAKNLQPIKGGNLKAISDDAVEVDADDESATDSVELRDAYVDNNEVIDSQKRVYSDSILHPSGKTVAKEAKRLNKMKAEDRDLRFKDANEHIDRKLDNLFEFQEMKKRKKNSNRSNSTINEDVDPNQVEFESGGKIHIKPENKGKFTAYKERTGKTTEEALHSEDPHVRKMANFAKNAKKWKHEEGGFLGNTAQLNPPKYNLADYKAGKYKGVAFTADDYNSFTEQSKALQQSRSNMLAESPTTISYLDKLLKQPANTPFTTKPKRVGGGLIGSDLGKIKQPDWTLDMANRQATAPMGNTSNQFNWQNASTQLATFAPNITNAFLQKKLKGPAAPFQESGTNLQRFSAEPQLAQSTRDFRQAQGIINKGTAQGSDLAAATGSLLAKRLNNNNQIYGQTNQLNAQVANQEAYLNQGTKARNAQRINQFRGDQVDFQNKKTQLSSENLANLSGKVLSQNRERNMMDKDILGSNVLAQSYGDSGIYQRNLQGMLDQYMGKKGMKPGDNKGGRLKLNRKKMC